MVLTRSKPVINYKEPSDNEMEDQNTREGGSQYLLQLARTNKALRSFLMSKRSSIAWKAARAAANPPVPICPKDLSEPKLAVLLFTKDCTVCGKFASQAPRLWYTLQVRACKPCFRSNLVFGRAAVQQYPYLDDFRTVLEVLPGES
ncbi:hypothetical protein FS837_004256, partial [Tulasnella sp. UAMH 9824]